MSKSIEEMIEVIDEYVLNSEIPILKEICCAKYWDIDVVRALGKEHERLGLALKRINYKKESAIESKFYKGELDKNLISIVGKNLNFNDEDNAKEVISEESLVTQSIINAVNNV